MFIIPQTYIDMQIGSLFTTSVSSKSRGEWEKKSYEKNGILSKRVSIACIYNMKYYVK